MGIAQAENMGVSRNEIIDMLRTAKLTDEVHAVVNRRHEAYSTPVTNTISNNFMKSILKTHASQGSKAEAWE